MPIFIGLPWVAAAAGVAALIMLLVALTRTRYFPIQARPLRGRRRIGQILIAALEIYRRRARLFLAIGLVFIPAGFLAALAHWTLLNLSPVEPVVPVPAANIAQEAVLLFAIGQLQFGLAYALVVAITTAALAAIDRERETSVELAFREVWRRILALALARFVAIFIVMALAFTIIGIPLALRQAVRWTFLEQAVLLDRRPPQAAFGESASAVGRDWWWSAATIVTLGVVGLAAAPAFGIFLIVVLRSTPVVYVNLIASAVYVALVPYVAIALALVYFDLCSRAEDAQPAAIERTG